MSDISDKTKQNNELKEQTTLKDLRVPPHNIALEQGVLATLMTIEDAFEKVSDILEESDFYAVRHRYIFRAIQRLSQDNLPYDTVLVGDWLTKENLLEQAGGEVYLLQLMKEASSNYYNLEVYAEKIKDFSTLRGLIKAASEILNSAYDTQGRDVGEILDLAETNLFSVSEKYSKRNSKSGPRSIQDISVDVISKLDELSKLDTGVTGLTTGFTELDNKTAGLQRGDLIIVGARPSMGKTTFAMNLVQSVIFNNDLPALVFSMEMPSDSIAMRLISSFGKIQLGHLRSGKMSPDEWSKVTTSIAHLQNTKLYIDDSPALPPTEVRSRARRVAKEVGGKLGLIMVDYLQLMKVPGMGDSRVGEVAEISRSLKALAKEMDCPVVALSQLNRSLESRPNKRPVMSDIRESGSIEQDADLIMFIYRDDVYNKENSKDPGIAEIIIGKQRQGPIGTVRLAFEGQYTCFSDLSPEYYQNQDEE